MVGGILYSLFLQTTFFLIRRCALPLCLITVFARQKNILRLNGKIQLDADSLLNCTQSSHSCYMFLNEGYLCSPRTFNSLCSCTNSAKKV
jgi:hypothetical protein